MVPESTTCVVKIMKFIDRENFLVNIFMFTSVGIWICFFPDLLQLKAMFKFCESGCHVQHLFVNLNLLLQRNGNILSSLFISALFFLSTIRLKIKLFKVMICYYVKSC